MPPSPIERQHNVVIQRALEITCEQNQNLKPSRKQIGFALSTSSPPWPPKPAPMPPPDPQVARVRLPEVPIVAPEVEQVDQDAEVNALAPNMYVINSDRDDSNVSDDSDVVAMLDEEQEFGRTPLAGTEQCLSLACPMLFCLELCEIYRETRNFASFLVTAFLVWVCSASAGQGDCCEPGWEPTLVDLKSKPKSKAKPKARPKKGSVKDGDGDADGGGTSVPQSTPNKAPTKRDGSPTDESAAEPTSGQATRSVKSQNPTSPGSGSQPGLAIVDARKIGAFLATGVLQQDRSDCLWILSVWKLYPRVVAIVLSLFK